MTLPRLLHDPRPNYTADAVRNKVTGIVLLAIVVERDGTVGPVRIARSLDSVYGLDDEAVRTVKKWRFIPGMKDGVPIRVAITVEMTFTLRDGPRATPGLSWPAALLPSDALTSEAFVEETISEAGFRVEVVYPKGWTLTRGGPQQQIFRVLKDDETLGLYMRVEGSAPRRLTPLPPEKLREF